MAVMKVGQLSQYVPSLGVPQFHQSADPHWDGKPNMFEMERLIRMIASRLRWDVTPGISPIHFIAVYESKTKVTVSIAIKPDDELVHIDDDKDLFPSDTLVTQLRLLIP